MLKNIFISILIIIMCSPLSFAQDNIQGNIQGKIQGNIAEYLQNISVTIRAKGSFSEGQGSGVLITRELITKKGSKKTSV